MPKLGYKQTEEHKRKISIAHIGMKKPWSTGKHFLGKKHTDEWKRKMSEANKGKHLSEQHRKKISESAHKGEKSNFWKGGITSVTMKIRNSIEYKLWREAVCKRDNYTCLWCFKGGGWSKEEKRQIKLNADHYPTTFSTLLNEVINIYGLDNLYENALSYERLWDINNGRTLCKDCHKKTDTYLRNVFKKR